MEHVRLPFELAVEDRVVPGAIEAHVHTDPGIIIFPPKVTAQCDSDGIARSAFAVLLRRPRALPQALDWIIDPGFELVVERILHEPDANGYVTDKYEMTLVAIDSQPGSHVIGMKFSHPYPSQPLEVRYTIVATVFKR